MRPFMDEVQQLNVGWIPWAVPNSQWAISLVHLIIGLACLFHMPQLISRFSNDGDGDWKLPDYPELDVDRVDREEIQ